MKDQTMTRRQALKVSTAVLLASSVPGCAVSPVVTKVVLRVPWRRIERIVRVVIRKVREMIELILTAITDGNEQEYIIQLTSEQMSALKNGASLFIRTQDGVEHKVRIEISQS
jgi:hypothetical protein